MQGETIWLRERTFDGYSMNNISKRTRFLGKPFSKAILTIFVACMVMRILGIR
jgi:hypothetical protein